MEGQKKQDFVSQNYEVLKFFCQDVCPLKRYLANVRNKSLSWEGEGESIFRLTTDAKEFV